MDLSTKDRPEGYQLFYDTMRHEFILRIKTELSHIVLDRLAQSGTLLAYHQGYGLDIRAFSYHREHWGYGGCITVNRDDTDSSWDIWTCPIIQIQSHKSRINDITCTFAVLFEVLNANIDALHIRGMSETQSATFATMVEPGIVASYWITSSLSRSCRQRIERMMQNSKLEGERVEFFKKIIRAMSDTYHICKELDVKDAFPTYEETSLLIANQYGASQGLLSVYFCDAWRIALCCIGATLSIDPKYSCNNQETGACFEPHNTDRAIHQLTLLAGLATCYEQLYASIA